MCLENKLGSLVLIFTPVDAVKISVKEPIQNWYRFIPHVQREYKGLNPPKTASEVRNLSSTMTLTAHCCGSPCQFRAVGPCVIGRELDLNCPDRLNWWAWSRVSMFEMKLIEPNTVQQGQVLDRMRNTHMNWHYMLITYCSETKSCPELQCYLRPQIARHFRPRLAQRGDDRIHVGPTWGQSNLLSGSIYILILPGSFFNSITPI